MPLLPSGSQRKGLIRGSTGRGQRHASEIGNIDKQPGTAGINVHGHNGYFKSLEGIVHFYNTREVKPVCPGDYTEAEALAAGCWPEPEFSGNPNTAEMGNLGLKPDEEAAIVAFLRTLSDQ